MVFGLIFSRAATSPSVNTLPLSGVWPSFTADGKTMYFNCQARPGLAAQIIHSDDSEKVSMFIDYRETANAPVVHKPHSIEQVVIDVDHRGVGGHYLVYRSLHRLLFAGNNLEYDIPVREDPYTRNLLWIDLGGQENLIEAGNETE
jgi:hypothetical protein